MPFFKVALSRVRSRAGLSLRHAIQPSQIKVDGCVQEFYRALKMAQERQKQQQQCKDKAQKPKVMAGREKEHGVMRAQPSSGERLTVLKLSSRHKSVLTRKK